MNPGSFFREVLESHEVRPSDRFLGCFGHASEHIFLMSDNATLLDTVEITKLRRFSRNGLAKSAVVN